MRIAVAAALLPAALYAAPIHYQPMRPQGSGMIERYSAAAAPANAWLDYYGGHVISNVHVVPVFWKSTVASDVQSTMPAFYAAVTNSTFWDFLAEYDTNILDFAGNQGTNQHIGHGTASKAITLTPSISSTTVTNDQIWQELQRQITAGNLPQPDANTLYMVHFPPGMSITMPDGNGGTAASCQQFCAYHNTTQASGSIPEFYYGVLPSVTTDGCQLGCGTGSGIANTESVASHELIEAVTDAEVGLATDNAPPLAWYDPQGQDGEIGDICNGSQGTITAAGQSWTVQTEWSNNQDACVTGPASNDFALQVSPGNRAISAGSSATFTVVSKVIEGTPGTISLSSGTMPAGVSATFSPAQISPGQSATVTVSVSSSATNGDNYWEITGSAGSTVRHAKGHANVSGGQAGGGGGGGNCPPGTIDLGGVCIPTGCSSTGSGWAWVGAFAAGAALMLFRRRRA